MQKKWKSSFRDFFASLSGQQPVWGFFPVRLAPASCVLRLVAFAMNLRSQFTRVATGDQAIFVARSVFEQAGGFPDIPLMEDVAFSKQLRKFAKPWCWTTPVVTSSRRWREQGTLKTIVLMWWLRFLFFLGVSPSLLHSLYYRKPAGEP